MNKSTHQMLTESEGTQGNAEEWGSLKGEHLYALMLKLRAQSSGELLPHAGQLAHAALFRWFAEVDATFAARLHEPNNRRPFTCSSLWFPGAGEPAKMPQEHLPFPIMPNHVYWLRFTLLTEILFRTFMTRFFQLPSPVPTMQEGPGLPLLRLGNVQFDVVEVTTTPSAMEHEQVRRWSGHATYSGLVEQARSLNVTKDYIREIGLEFCSPTAFSNGQRAGGKQMHLFPDPDRVFDSLVRSWNTWAPSTYAFDKQALQAYIRDWVTVVFYDLQTQPVHFNGAPQAGFTGKCVYVLETGRTPTRSSCHLVKVGAGLTPAQALYLLSEFAFYAGVGYKTAMGMGHTRCFAQHHLKNKKA